MRKKISSIAKAFLTLRARKLAIVRDARRPTAWSGRIPATAAAATAFQATQGGMVASVIDNVKGVRPAQKARGFYGGIEAVVAAIRSYLYKQKNKKFKTVWKKFKKSWNN